MALAVLWRARQRASSAARVRRTFGVSDGVKLRLILLVLALSAFAVALFELRRGSDGVTAQPVAIPATVFAPPSGPAKAVVVIAHGFAGSQQMMAPLATSFARDGYLAITFDFAGHGRNPQPMHGGVVDMDSSTRQLLGEIDDVIGYAKARPEFDGRLALVGHSMASELIVQAAQRRDDVGATVALSLFGRSVTATSPRNLLVIDGALEFAVLRDAARRIVGLTAADPQEDTTYGDFAQGTARRYGFARGAEHIGVIWSLDALEKSRDWLDAAFGQKPTVAGVDRRGPWLGLMLIAVVALMRLAVEGLPRVRAQAPRCWRGSICCCSGRRSISMSRRSGRPGRAGRSCRWRLAPSLSPSRRRRRSRAGRDRRGWPIARSSSASSFP